MQLYKKNLISNLVWSKNIQLARIVSLTFIFKYDAPFKSHENNVENDFWMPFFILSVVCAKMN